MLYPRKKMVETDKQSQECVNVHSKSVREAKGEVKEKRASVCIERGR